MQVPVWDAPTRLFHWALAILAVLSFTTGKLGGSWMGWHVKSGYAILAFLGRGGVMPSTLVSRTVHAFGLAAFFGWELLIANFRVGPDAFAGRAYLRRSGGYAGSINHDRFRAAPLS